MKAPGIGKRDSPERTGEVASSDDDAGSAATAAAGQGQEEVAGANASGGQARLVVEVSEDDGRHGPGWLRCWFRWGCGVKHKA